MKPMDIEKEWVEFKTKKLEQVYTDLEAKKLQEEEDTKNATKDPLSWEKEQQVTKDYKLNALKTLEGGADFVEWTGGMVLKKGSDGKYYKISNQSKKIDIEGMDGYSIASYRAELRK